MIFVRYSRQKSIKLTQRAVAKKKKNRRIRISISKIMMVAIEMETSFPIL
jgi:hypothetical protein